MVISQTLMLHGAELAQQAVLQGGLALEAAQHALHHAPPDAAVHSAPLVQLVQDGQGGISASDYARRVQEASRSQEQQLGWLTSLGKHFIGVFQKGGEVFMGFVTGIIPTLVVLMTAFYAVTELVGERRVHGIAQAAGRYALTRYTLLPLLSVFFLTNPMAYTFGTFLEERHKPAFYDSAVSFVHPVLGLFPHANAGEYFVWGGVLVALMELERAGKVPPGYHVTIAIYYFAVGLVVILLKGIVTEWITRILARRQGVTL
ncbi:PTS glucitol/sorbitol transporter subunit IIC [Pseudoroseomonas cervicalis]|uniref:PTS glucitol/sorbitol transporter subunit IIC n=1 Tax=Teichococcus cervicalis TaxID=204525 RepID=UPI00278A5260|nr:PTS glucitol/sorbitol transporter subunit IIC [Pseudoroseomonas cervicalis]MDQ1078052.1 PTS system glucitol/sorbitol-specific IIC component [Pseudoroseomonas cervicalis]